MLFNLRTDIRNLETAYEEMIKIAMNGELPRDIFVKIPKKNKDEL